jgi:hypothetical protein
MPRTPCVQSGREGMLPAYLWLVKCAIWHRTCALLADGWCAAKHALIIRQAYSLSCATYCSGLQSVHAKAGSCPAGACAAENLTGRAT